MKCKCGCGNTTKGSNKYINGHNVKPCGLITSADRIKEMRRIFAERSGFHYYNEPEEYYHMSFKEIAEELGVSIPCVELIYLNAMHKIMWQFVGRDLEGIV